MPGYEHDKQANKQLTALNPCRKRGERQGKQGHAPGVHGDQKPGKSLGFAKILGDSGSSPMGRTSVVTNMKAARAREKQAPRGVCLPGF